MKKTVSSGLSLGLLVLFICSSAWAAGPTYKTVSTPSASTEDWKGASDKAEAQIGFLTGLGIIDSSGGFALLPTLSKKIADRSFIPDINDSVWIEAEVGPIFFSGTTALFYSAHVRWDFIKDDAWTLYALGGAAGNLTNAVLGNHFQLYPRFAAGVMWQTFPLLKWRAEFSHELIAVGAVFPF